MVFCRLRYRLTLRDLSEILLLRGIEVSHEAIRDWETKLRKRPTEAADYCSTVAAAVLADASMFQGSSSATRLTGWSAMQPRICRR